MISEMFLILFLINSVATVDRIEGDSVNVSLRSDGEDLSLDIPKFLIPCNIREGDRVYIDKSDSITRISCSEIDSSSAGKVDIRIDPASGRVEYVIRGLEIELEQ